MRKMSLLWILRKKGFQKAMSGGNPSLERLPSSKSYVRPLLQLSAIAPVCYVVGDAPHQRYVSDGCYFFLLSFRFEDEMRCLVRELRSCLMDACIRWTWRRKALRTFKFN